MAAEVAAGLREDIVKNSMTISVNLHNSLKFCCEGVSDDQRAVTLEEINRRDVAMVLAAVIRSVWAGERHIESDKTVWRIEWGGTGS